MEGLQLEVEGVRLAKEKLCGDVDVMVRFESHRIVVIMCQFCNKNVYLRIGRSLTVGCLVGNERVIVENDPLRRFD